MYRNILIPVENSATDDVILEHIKPLAHLTKARLLLVHVADGFVARNQEQFNLEDSEEIREDRSYLNRQREKLSAEGLNVVTMLACGEPANQILKVAEKEGCDLIAMATHGHRLVGDIFWGSVAENIRHRTSIPILLVRSPKRG